VNSSYDADGSRLVVASRQVLQRDKSGNPVAILEINSDITERKRAERQCANRPAFSTHARHNLRARDDDAITYWNRGGEELYGWKKEEAIGRIQSRPHADDLSRTVGRDL